MVKRVTLILLIWVGVFGSPAQAQTPSNPYIYYYSDSLNAFVIERADRTDTRVLGAGLMALTGEATAIHVSGPGWSPSGEWFAWTAAQIGNQGWSWSGYRPYAVSADGTQRVTLLDDFQDAQLEWAADEDWLYVAARQSTRLHPEDPEDSHSVIDTYLAVIDVASDTVITEFENQTFSDYYPYEPGLVRPTVIRTNDGMHFIASYVDYEGGDSFSGTAQLVTLGTDGTITITRLDAYGPLNITDFPPDFPSISAAGWIVYPTEDSLQVENILSRVQYTLPPLDTSVLTPWNAHNKMHWDDSGQFALISDGNLWLLDCTTGTLTLLREDWMFHDDYAYYTNEWPVWLPDSRYAVLFGEDGVLYVFDRTTGALAETGISTEDIVPQLGWYWFDDTHAVIYESGPVKRMLVYDVASLAADYLDVDLTTNSRPRLSPDSQFIAFVHDGAVITNRATVQSLEIRPDYGSFNTFSDGEVLWDDNSEWLFIFEDAIGAGGAYIRHMGIVRADGTSRRDLSTSWAPGPITLNWLPPQVDPADLPPVTDLGVPQPDRVFAGTRWSFNLDWSPDGRWLAVANAGGNITVWETATGDIVHTFEGAGEDERVVWPAGDVFVPDLTIPDHVPVWRAEQILAQSPDGSQTVQTIDFHTQVIDTETNRLLSALPSNTMGFALSASYSPDGRLLATAIPYWPVYLWDTITWDIVATLPNPGQAVAFSPDGTQLAVTASWDVQIWNVADLLD